MKVLLILVGSLAPLLYLVTFGDSHKISTVLGGMIMIGGALLVLVATFLKSDNSKPESR